jgi:purine-nucleoside phosphorylase
VLAGCRTIFITNASGGIREDLSPGDFVLIQDHLNLTGRSPLTALPTARSNEQSWPSAPAGARIHESGIDEPRSAFVDMTDAWSLRLRRLAKEADPMLVEGVYAQLPGPHFETPAEIRMLRTLGAHLVGMSSVLEAIAARHLGAELLGVSVVTNLAAGITSGTVSSQSVGEVAKERSEALGLLLAQIAERSARS